MNVRTWVLLVCAALVLGAAWTYQQRVYSQTTATPSATPVVSAPPQVSALARLEPASKVIKVQVPAARQMDRVLQWYVNEGQPVRKAQLLARLDGAARAQQEVEVARTRVIQARARLGQVLAGSKQGEIDRQRGEILRLSAELERQQEIRRIEVARLETDERLTRRNYERYRSLYAQGACSALEVEQRQLTWNGMQRQVQQARGELARSGDTLRAQLLSANGELRRIQEVRPSDVALAEADIEAAQADLRRTQVALDECQILSPQSGTVLRIHTRAGERIAVAGLADVAATGEMVAIAEVYQNDLGRLRLQQRCQLNSPALAKPLQGRVVRLGQQVQRQNIFAEQAGEQFDQRVVEVRIVLDSASSPQASNWTNLQVQAVFEGL
ncbi:HlyD family efflux transporter periplasmic adaptor subunit [bacterium]|nr:HlyD family efflux transporter periplasmic adaptor subunit [bacterium]